MEVTLCGALAALLSEVPLDAGLPRRLADLPAGDLLVYQQGADAGQTDGLLQKILNRECLPASLARHLAQCQPVATLEQAWSQRTALAAGQCFITAQGEQVFSDGLLLQAETARNTGVLARQQEIRRLEDEQAQLDTALEAHEQQEQNCNERLQQCEQLLQQCAAERRPLQQQLTEIGSQQASLQTRIQHSQQRTKQLAEERQQLQEEETQLLETLAEDRELWQESLMQLESSSGQLDSQREAREQLRQQRDRQRQLVRDRQQALQEARLRQQQLLTREQAAGQALERLQERLNALDERHEQLLMDLEAAREPADERTDQLDLLLEQHQEQEGRVQQLRQQQQLAQQEQRELEQQRSVHGRELDRLRGLLEQQRLQQQTLMVKRDGHLEQLRELDITLREVIEQLPEEALESRWQTELDDTLERIRRLGAINLAAIEEYDQQAERKNYLDAQNAELEYALNTLDQAIRRIDRETRIRFRETFERVNQGLQTLFPRVFGGGTAWLQLIGDDLLETGVAIMARPPGKKNATIHLLSGGEKALTALALVFSIFELNPAPFCMLDEVDAPLDDANVGRYARLVREMSGSIQFIYITHNKQAMESADQLMGVTMQEPGVSRLVSVDLEEASAMVAS